MNKSTKVLLTLAVFLCAAFSSAQTTVILAPLPQLQFFDQSGRPLAFGCVYTFASGTTTPLGTFTDSSGVTPNPNPVILTSGGSANIWLQAGQSYTVRVKSFGGTNCSSGSTLYTVNGIGGGASTQTTIVPSSPTPTFTDTSQNELFQFTITSNTVATPLVVVGVTPPGSITFQLTEDSVGGHTFTWPSNMYGACPINIMANAVTVQAFVWNGTTALATGPCIIGNVANISTGTVTSSSVVNAEGGFQYNSAAPANHILVGNGTAYVDSGVLPAGFAVSTVFADGVIHSVNASTTSQQNINFASISNLNAVGKSFRLTTHVTTGEAGSTSMAASIGYGLTSALGVYASMASATTALTTHNAIILTCTTITAGSSGIMGCNPEVNTDMQNGGAASLVIGNRFTISTDLTQPLFIGISCNFGSANSGNSCNSSQFVLEQLN